MKPNPNHTPPSSPLIFLIGFMGSGKSLLSRGVGMYASVTTVEMDDEIVSRAGMTINQVFHTKGEGYFRNLEREVLHELIARYKNSPHPVLLSTGGGVPCHFDNMTVMNQNGTTVFIDVPPNRLAARLENKKQERPLIREKTAEEIRDYVSDLLRERMPFYRQAQIRINPVWNDKDLNIRLLRDVLLEREGSDQG